MHGYAGMAVGVVLAGVLASGMGPGPTRLGLVAVAQAADQSGQHGKAQYVAPVAAPVADSFRRPAQPWLAGNRGIDFDSPPNTEVRAAAAGEVVFAGVVAGSRHVVVLHPDGLRTSYSFLANTQVGRGDRVEQGTVLGVTLARLHFGVRAGEEYLDPEALLVAPMQVYLVPDEHRGPAEPRIERSAVARLLRSVARRGGSAARDGWDWARDQAEPYVSEARGALHYLAEATPVPRAYRLYAGLKNWAQARTRCTPISVPAPRLKERRRVVLVAGLGSSSTQGAIDDVDTDALGYAPGDVSRFSYRGGSVADRPYGPEDTTADLALAARRLREYLATLSEPGVAVDLIAHSQGGVVAHAALAEEFDGLDERLPEIRTLVALGSPHRGSDVATAAFMTSRSTAGESAENLLALALDNGIGPTSPALAQLSETSSFTRALRDKPLPAGIRATSIAARGDLLVAAPRTRLPGAEHVTLSLPGLFDDHAALPGSPPAQREIALSLNAMGPTCEAAGDVLGDLLVSDAIGWAWDAAGAGLWVGGRRLDSRASRKSRVPSGPMPKPRRAPSGRPRR